MARLSRLFESVTLVSENEATLTKDLQDKRRKLDPREHEKACGMLVVTKPITSYRAPAPFRSASEKKMTLGSILHDITAHKINIKLLLEYVEFDDIRRFNADLRATEKRHEVRIYWRRIYDRQEISNLKSTKSLRMTLEFPFDGHDERTGKEMETQDTHLVMIYSVLVARHVPPPPEFLFPTEDQVSPPLPRFFVEYSLAY
tara:strand:+ start:242 stop:844 length:603 start_codon:yes stop_codon:yes gene_type:complete